MSRRGGKGRGGKVNTTTTTQQKTEVPIPVAPKLPPIVELITKLLVQAFEDLSKNEAPSPQSAEKFAVGLEAKLVDYLKTPKDADKYHRLAVGTSLGLQMELKIPGASAKKVVKTIYTFLMDELTNHWDEYGLEKDAVHPDYHQPQHLGQGFKLQDINQEDYQIWANSFTFFQ